MAHENEASLSSMQLAVAQDTAHKMAKGWKKEIDKMLGDAVAPQRLAAEDLAGHGLGLAVDLGNRLALAKWTQQDIANKETLDQYHTRYDRWSAGISIGLGVLAWGGSIVSSESAPLEFGTMVGRAAGATAAVLGVNRLLSSWLGIPG